MPNFAILRINKTALFFILIMVIIVGLDNNSSLISFASYMYTAPYSVAIIYNNNQIKSTIKPTSCACVQYVANFTIVFTKAQMLRVGQSYLVLVKCTHTLNILTNQQTVR